MATSDGCLVLDYVHSELTESRADGADGTLGDPAASRQQFCEVKPESSTTSTPGPDDLRERKSRCWPVADPRPPVPVTGTG